MTASNWPNTDWERIDRMTEEEIEAAAASDPDTIIPTDEELAAARPLTKREWLEECFGAEAAAAMMAKAAE